MYHSGDDEWEIASEVPPSPDSVNGVYEDEGLERESKDMTPRVTFPSLGNGGSDSDDPPQLRLAHTDPPRYLRKSTRTYEEPRHEADFTFGDPRRSGTPDDKPSATEIILAELRQTRVHVDEQMETMRQRLDQHEHQRTSPSVSTVSDDPRQNAGRRGCSDAPPEADGRRSRPKTSEPFGNVRASVKTNTADDRRGVARGASAGEDVTLIVSSSVGATRAANRVDVTRRDAAPNRPISDNKFIRLHQWLSSDTVRQSR